MTQLDLYIETFNEDYLVEAFCDMVKADATRITDNYEIDIIDVELFIEKYCVAFGEDGIGKLIIDEWNKRKAVFDCVTNESAREMAVNALREHFFYEGATFVKAESICASIYDILDEKYHIFEIDFEDDTKMVLAMDFSKAHFDVENFVNNDWSFSPQELKTIIQYAEENI